MKEKVKLPIKNLIINKENIIELAEYLFKQKNKQEVNYKIKFKNQQEIESDDISIFNNRKFEEYEISLISMHYYSENNVDRIDIYIYNNDMFELSSVEIISSNSEWFATSEKSINEILTFCNEQNKIWRVFRNYKVQVFLIICISLVSTLFLVGFINKIIDIKDELFKSLLTIFFVFFVFLYACLIEKMQYAFPNVEISILDKNNVSKRKRRLIIVILTSVILPIVLNLVYDFIKCLIL